MNLENHKINTKILDNSPLSLIHHRLTFTVECIGAASEYSYIVAT